MRYREILGETADAAAPYVLQGSKARFTIGRDNYEAEFERMGWCVELSFYKEQWKDTEMKFRPDASDNPFLLFGTVVAITREYLRTKRPDFLTFTADDPKRKKFYPKLGVKMAAGLDYDVFIHKKAHVVLKRRDQEFSPTFYAVPYGASEAEEVAYYIDRALARLRKTGAEVVADDRLGEQFDTVLIDMLKHAGFGDVQGMDTNDIEATDDLPWHAWVRVGNRYYDAVTPLGVEAPLALGGFKVLVGGA